MKTERGGVKLANSSDERRDRTPDAHAFWALGVYFALPSSSPAPFYAPLNHFLNLRGREGAGKRRQDSCVEAASSVATKPLGESWHGELREGDPGNFAFR